MGYERNDRNFGRGDGRRDYRDTDRGRNYGGQNYGGQNEGSSDYSEYRGNRFGGDYGRDSRGYDDQDRGFFERAGDEVRSWFGDEDAERRRRADERYEGRYDRDQRYTQGYGGDRGRSGSDRYAQGGGYGRSDYGADRSAGATRNWGQGSSQDRNDWGRDPGYHSWRSRQLEQFDRDYDEYRREHQQKFDNEFHGWRQTRQSQRELLAKVQEHQEVVGSDGQHIGTVDHVRGDRIQLTKSDQSAGGHHHSIPSSWIQSVEDTVKINKTADQAKAQWRDEQRNEGGLFGGRDEDRGNTNLNRSFSGTY